MSHSVVSAIARLVPWLCLLALSSTAAYAMDVAVQSVPRTEAAASTVDDAEDAPGVIITISSWDPTYGSSEWVRCMTSSNRVSSDELLVDANEVILISTNLCRPNQD